MGSGGSRIDDSLRKNVSNEFFIAIHINRHIYYWLILLISIWALLGNICVIRTVLLRKYKYLQKTCMISLAISDILTVVTFCINYLDLLGKERNLIWSTGDIACWYNPVGQVLGNLCSSIALLIIALDRYHNVIYALSKKWDPAWWKCLVGALLIWTICFGISYPMATFYFNIPLRLPSGQNVSMCTATTTSREHLEFYYILVVTIFFLPLITMFFCFYYKIALLVWRHRNPIPQRLRRKNIHMERKIRTFKIVIVLIFAFIFCRMPYWLFWLVKLLSRQSGDAVWRATLIFTTFNLLNCALNPLLYTYLNQTIYICKKVNDCLYSTLCCCFSNTEFEDYEKGTPIYEGVMGRVATVEQMSEGFPQVPRFPKYTSVNKF